MGVGSGIGNLDAMVHCSLLLILLKNLMNINN